MEIRKKIITIRANHNHVENREIKKKNLKFDIYKTSKNMNDFRQID